MIHEPAVELLTVECVGAVCLCTTGLSHWRNPAAWQTLFARWSEQGTSGALANGLMHAAVGAIFVLAHPVWTGASSLLTYWATLVLAKGLTYLAFPEVGLARMRALTPERAEALRLIGFPMTLLGLTIGCIALL